MASHLSSGQIPGTSLVHGSQAPSPAAVPSSGGKPLPPGGNGAAAAAAPAPERSVPTAGARPNAPPPPPPPPAPRPSDPASLVAALNHFLNDSGRPDQFRIAPNSGNTLIQQINPATGDVVGVFPIDEFPALARAIGATGLLVDSRA